jgi:energy-coupling factor transporter ATP-binding protein EcfA2
MKHLFEHLFADLWNHWTRPRHESPSAEDLGVGSVVVDGRTTRQRVAIPQIQRTEALAILGKTGQGKSSLLRHLAIQDIEYGRGFLFFDLHGDTTDFLLSQIAAAETRTRRDLSAKLIVIEPGDPAYSIGLNILEPQPGVPVFSQAAEFTQVLKQRWHLDHLGARTEELLRNSLHVLVDNRLTLIEISALLTNQAFRTACLRQSTNPEVTTTSNLGLTNKVKLCKQSFATPFLTKRQPLPQIRAFVISSANSTLLFLCWVQSTTAAGSF